LRCAGVFSRCCSKQGKKHGFFLFPSFSFCVWQALLQCPGGQRNKLWELQWPRLHKEHYSWRPGCGSTDRGKALLLPEQWRVLLEWNESCYQCWRFCTYPSTCIKYWKWFSIKYSQQADDYIDCILCCFGMVGPFSLSSSSWVAGPLKE